MIFSIFFIIFNFVQLVTNTNLNYTINDNCNVCTISLFRRKRAPVDYPRWYGNVDTTREFIVKVLDEDITTPRTRQIIAVNIQPVTKRAEKLIIGGARIYSTSTASTAPDDINHYTRFVPPTSGDSANLAPFLKSKDDIILPKGLKKHGNLNTKLQPHSYPERDESPPAAPKFVSRSPVQTQHVLQYAPVPPVLFSRRSTITPITPREVTRKPGYPVTRTNPNYDIMAPLRTSGILDFFSLNYIDEEIPIKTVWDSAITHRTSNVQESTLSKHVVFTARRQEDIPSQKSVDEKDFSYDRIHFGHKINTTRKFTTSKSSTTLKFFENKESDGNEEFETNQSDIETDDKNRQPTQKVVSKTTLCFRKPSKTEYEISTGMTTDEDEFHSEETSSSAIKAFRVKTRMPISRKSFKNGLQPTRSSKCSFLKIRHINFNAIRTLHEIVTQLKQWADVSPVAKWVDITDGNLTVMENPIHLMIVDDPSRGQIISAKQTVLIVAGIQGKDHHTVAASMYLLYQLIERSESHADILSKYRFWVIPVLNPDGYDYSMTFPRKQSWTKNLRQKWDPCKGKKSCKLCAQYGLRCIIQPCYGVNLDRNFEYQWIPPEELRSEHPCGDLYAGPRQLSEIETLALTHYLHQQKTPVYIFIAFKEGEVLGVMYPHSHTRKKRALDHVYRQRASRAAAAAYSIGGRPYVAGQTSEFLPLYAGGIEDWVEGHLGIDNTYTIMMFRPTDSQDSNQVTERVVHEAYAATDTLLLESISEPFVPKRPVVTVTRASAILSTLPSRKFIAFATAVILLGYG